MGAGKSTVGEILADHLRCEFHDSDVLIVARMHKGIPEIFAEQGEEGFREIESAVIKDLAGRPPAVIALGGGAVARAANRKLLQESGISFYLKWRPEKLLERIFDDTNRPLVSGRARESRRHDLLMLYRSRSSIYETADHVVTCEPEMMPAEIADVILQKLGGPDL